MSLSETCLEQRDKDEQKVKLWIVGGLVASAVIHGGIFALALNGFLDREIEIAEEDAIEFIVIEEEVIEEEEIEPEPEEIVEEPEPIPEEIPEEIVEEPEPIPEEIPEEIVEEFAPVEPPLEQAETESLQPAPPAPQSLPEPIAEPIAEQPPPEPAPLAPPEPEPIAEEPPPEPAPAAEPAPDPLAATSEEPVSEPEPLPEDLPPEPMAPPEPLADSAPPEPLASADIAPDAPMTNPLGELEVETGAANTPAETPDTNDTAALGAAGAERSQPTQGAVPQPGTSGSPTGLEGSFAGIGSGESPTGGQTPGIGDQAFGGSPLDGRGGEAPGRPDGVEGGTGNDTGNETDTAYAGGGRLSCVDNCQPRYPNSLRNQGIEGTVIVRGLVGTDGRVTEPEIVQSSGNSDLDEAALQAASQMRFLPPEVARPFQHQIDYKLN
ncbi:energy transducer TonB [Capilliphycus salinus ALCB114379]|uniref:energy transducer TonB n=1 Tax=Capilliphycus salinus TaxID=2768948 RepID=UPI0039A4BB9A